MFPFTCTVSDEIYINTYLHAGTHTYTYTEKERKKQGEGERRVGRWEGGRGKERIFPRLTKRLEKYRTNQSVCFRVTRNFLNWKTKKMTLRSSAGRIDK